MSPSPTPKPHLASNLPVLAVTGGIAEGKSTVVDFLSGKGLRTCSADTLVRQLWEVPDIRSDALEQLGLPPSAGKTQIREKITEDAAARRRLNAYFHPLVQSQMLASRADVFEVPLLIEACMFPLFQRVWVVTCGPQIQRQRLMDRKISAESADKILSSQLPTRAKIPFAHAVFRTNFDLPDVHEQVLAEAKSLFDGLD